MKDETVGAVYTHTHTHTIHSTKKNGNYLLDEREPQFSKINIEENRGKKASICDREKDRKQTDCIKQEDWKVFEVNAIVKFAID